MKIRLVGAKLTHVDDTRTGKHNEANSCLSKFC